MLNLQRIVRKRIVRIVVFVMVVLFPMPVHADKIGWPQNIRIGFVPAIGQDTHDYHRPLTEHLKKNLGTEVVTVSGKDYAGVIKALVYKQIEFAYLGPKSYIEAKEQTEIEPLVMELGKDGKPGYYSLIISKKGSGIDTIESAKGKSFAFTDPNSTSGYLVPTVMFVRDLHIDLKTYFKSVIFSGSHADSIRGVREGRIEVAATNTFDMYQLQERKEISEQDFNILKKSEIIPGSPVCARKDLPESLKTAFQNAMLSFKDNQNALKTMYVGGFVKTDDKTYDVIRELERYRKQIRK
ncbi:MAG: phosphonate ABC transporter substrate-binding protein [Desulfobacteraceae bacterium IS3]|nr:MAG: phosphonate ABC transporter substrate-binding protein [Desulfobacteraceae bacterium IS3]